MQKHQFFSASVITCILVLVIASSSQAARFRVGIPSETMAQIAIYAALDNGYYSSDGLDIQLILMRAPVANMALIGGDVQFTTAGVSAISAAARGAPLKVIFNSFTRPLHWIYARPEIRNPKEMKGRRMGVDGRGAAMH
jgi:ABC-type nitrate/sulfonate/bicarbonate transport system substrate-binding protein